MKETITKQSIILNVCKWDPKNLKTSTPVEIAMSKTWKLDGKVKATLAEFAKIPGEHISFVRPYNYQMKKKKKTGIAKLFWELAVNANEHTAFGFPTGSTILSA